MLFCKITGNATMHGAHCLGHSKNTSDLDDVMMASINRACLSNVKGSSLGPETCSMGSVMMRGVLSAM
jgi:hypothetical protein